MHVYRLSLIIVQMPHIMRQIMKIVERLSLSGMCSPRARGA
jgi:hypothetical protein